MPAKKWNFFILFQYYQGDNDILYDLITSEITNLDSNCNINFFILKHTDDEYIEIYKTIPAANHLEIQQVGLRKQTDNFFSFPYYIASEIWCNFFKLGNNIGERNFIAIYNHGAGLGFTPKAVSKLPVDNNTALNFLSNNFIDIQKLFNSTEDDLEFKSLKHPFINKKIPLIPVSVFNTALVNSGLVTASKKIDFLCLANCFMQCAENGYILKDTIKHLIACEGLYVNPGLNLPKLYEALILNLDDKSIAENITANMDDRFNKREVIDYINRLDGKDKQTYLTIRGYFSISVNNLQKYAELKERINQLCILLFKEPYFTTKILKQIIKIRASSKYCQDVFTSNPIGVTDLSNFLYHVVNLPTLGEGQNTVSKDIQKNSYGLINFILHDIVVSSHFPEFAYRKNEDYLFGVCPLGISIFFPGQKNSHRYNEITKLFYDEFFVNQQYLSDFLKNTKWFDFVKEVYNSSFKYKKVVKKVQQLS